MKWSVLLITCLLSYNVAGQMFNNKNFDYYSNYLFLEIPSVCYNMAVVMASDKDAEEELFSKQ